MKTALWIVGALLVIAIGYSWWASSKRTVSPPAISGGAPSSGGGLLDAITNAVRSAKGLVTAIRGPAAPPAAPDGGYGYV